MTTSAQTPALRKAATGTHVVLDPSTLGRPMHLLGAFTAQFRAALSESFRTGLNRRYGATFEVLAVDIAPRGSDAPRGRWFGCTTPLGDIAFAMDRALLLTVLDYRYGAPVRAVAEGGAADPVRETATEERLAATLCARWTETLVACIDPAGAAQPCHASPGGVPEASGWALTVRLAEAGLPDGGHLHFVLDGAVMGRLLASLSPLRDKARTTSAAHRPPVAARLPLVLTGRLLEKELALGDVLDLRPGDVIPVRLGLADVLVDDSRLFTAAVTEHKGKLCLTSFDESD